MLTKGQRPEGKQRFFFAIEKIGDRPAGQLPADCELMTLVEAVDRHLAIRTEMRLASTDANIPLSLGIPAVSIGGGGEGGGIHTHGEWYDARGRDLGLRRILLAVAGGGRIVRHGGCGEHGESWSFNNEASRESD
jgi:hypothetical protein